MMKDAERYAEEDKKRREAAQKLNEADAVCYEAEKMLAEFSEKLTAEVKKKIEDALKNTREALTKKDAPLAAERAEVLKKALKEGTILYAQTPGATKAPPAQPPPRSGGGAMRRLSGAGPRRRVWMPLQETSQASDMHGDSAQRDYYEVWVWRAAQTQGDQGRDSRLP
jgi:molecular chaperone DnaK